MLSCHKLATIVIQKLLTQTLEPDALTLLIRAVYGGIDVVHGIMMGKSTDSYGGGKHYMTGAAAAFALAGDDNDSSRPMEEPTFSVTKEVSEHGCAVLLRALIATKDNAEASKDHKVCVEVLQRALVRSTGVRSRSDIPPNALDEDNNATPNSGSGATKKDFWKLCDEAFEK